MFDLLITKAALVRELRAEVEAGRWLGLDWSWPICTEHGDEPVFDAQDVDLSYPAYMEQARIASLPGCDAWVAERACKAAQKAADDAAECLDRAEALLADLSAGRHGSVLQDAATLAGIERAYGDTPVWGEVLSRAEAFAEALEGDGLPPCAQQALHEAVLAVERAIYETSKAKTVDGETYKTEEYVASMLGFVEASIKPKVFDPSAAIEFELLLASIEEDE